MTTVPDHYKPGSRLSIRLAESDATVTVVDVFTPFTSFSQVLVVKLINPIPAFEHLTKQPLILKIYDPRYLKDRESNKYHPERPWSYSAELQAKKTRLPGHVSKVRALHHEPEEDDLVGLETWYFDREEATYNRELAAYKKLGPLQGTGVPRFFASGTLLPPEPRAIDIRLLLLEYIPDASNIRDLDPRLLTTSLIKSLFHTVDSLGPLGVTHGDLNQTNIIFSPGVNPRRAVIIDFGGSWVRDANESGEDWNEVVGFQADGPNLERMLRISLVQINKTLEDYIPPRPTEYVPI